MGGFGCPLSLVFQHKFEPGLAHWQLGFDSGLAQMVIAQPTEKLQQRAS